MKNNAVALRFLEDGESIPISSTWFPCHMIFDVKVYLTRKERHVAGGHWTETPAQLTYSIVVIRESVHTAFLLTALNDVDVLAAGIRNAYLQVPCREQIHTTAGPEFGPNQ